MATINQPTSEAPEIGQFELTRPSELAALGIDEPRTLTLYALRIPCPSEKYPDAWRACYEIVEQRHNTSTKHTHQLAQNGNVMYHDGLGPCFTESVDMLKTTQMPCLHHRPRWKRGEASWPFAGKGAQGPFHFAAHFYIAESRKNTQRAGQNAPATTLLCLFLNATFDDGLRAQIFTQDINEQTAEEHYALEAAISIYEKSHGQPAEVEKIIRSGGKLLHEYILEHPKTTAETLALLAQYGKTKQLKTAAQKRLTLFITHGTH